MTEDYRILNLLGSGGMGSVYRVRHLPSNQIQALKQLHPHHTEPLARARFVREFQLCEKLHHPLFLNVFHLHQSAEQTFYTMEFLEGETLDVFLHRMRKSMPWQGWLDRLSEIVASLLEGLEYLHQQGVIHRDLKPQNILITSQGESKLLDLGLASHYHLSRLTDKGTLIGTPQYMAPELLQDLEMDVRSDLYSLGVIIYEALSGSLPFPQTELMALLQNLILKPPPALLPLGPLPANLADWVMRLLSKEPALRPSSAAQALQEWRSLFSTGLYTNPEKELILSLLTIGITGRENLIRQAWEMLAQRPRVLGLVGAAGLGKSRLLDALERRLKDKGFPCYRLRPGGARQTPFEPWANLLSRLIGPKLPPSLSDCAPTLASLMPRLGNSHGGDRMELFSAVLRVLRELIPRAWLVLDDLDRFSEEDLELLRYLVTQAGESPQVLCSADDRSWWSLGLPGQTLPVESLESADLERLASAAVGGRIDSALSQCLIQESRGNPMVALEILKTLCAEKKLVRYQGVVSARELTGISLQEVLQRRLAKLSPLQVDMLFLIACARGRLQFDELYQATGESPPDLLAAIEPLLRIQMLHEPAPGQYTMAPHLCAFLEGHVPESSLRGWHTQLALSLGQLQRSPERVAYHWLQAGVAERACKPLELAARLHLKARNFGRALALLDQLGQIQSPLSPELQEKRADALFRCHQNSAARSLYEQIPQSHSQARLTGKIARCLWREGNINKAHHYNLLTASLQNLILPSQSWKIRAWTLTAMLRLWLTPRPLRGTEESPQDRNLSLRLKNHVLLSRSLFLCRPPGWQLDFVYLNLRHLGWRDQGLEAQREIVMGICCLLGPRQLYGRARRHLERGLDMALGMPGSQARAELLADAGFHLLALGHPHVHQVTQALYRQAQLLGDPALSLQACQLQGLYHRLAGRLLDSQQAYAEAALIAAEGNNLYEQELIQANLTMLAALAGSPSQELPQGVASAGYFLSQQLLLARAYRAWRAGEKEEVWRSTRSGPGDYTGDLLLIAERTMLRALSQPDSADALHQLEARSQEVFPVFRCVALRLRAALQPPPQRRSLLRQALGLARRWDFALEEGLILADLAHLEGDFMRYQKARNRLMQAGAAARVPAEPTFLGPG